MDKSRLVLTACLAATLGISVAMAGPKVKRETVSTVSIEEQKVAPASRTGRELEEQSPGTGTTVEQALPLDNPLGDSPVSVALHPGPDAHYVIPWQSINAGGGPSSSANYAVNASVGQSTIGQASSANYAVGVGYWYGADVGGGGDCVCDCQGDEECNGLPTVFDLVFCVAEAFRNEPYSLDPNVTCPLLAQNDLTLDGEVNVFDVVFITNMAFRNGLREDNVCDPCTEVGPPSCPF